MIYLYTRQHFPEKGCFIYFYHHIHPELRRGYYMSELISIVDKQRGIV